MSNGCNHVFHIVFGQPTNELNWSKMLLDRYASADEDHHNPACSDGDGGTRLTAGASAGTGGGAATVLPSRSFPNAFITLTKSAAELQLHRNAGTPPTPGVPRLELRPTLLHVLSPMALREWRTALALAAPSTSSVDSASSSSSSSLRRSLTVIVEVGFVRSCGDGIDVTVLPHLPGVGQRHGDDDGDGLSLIHI